MYILLVWRTFVLEVGLLFKSRCAQTFAPDCGIWLSTVIMRDSYQNFVIISCRLYSKFSLYNQVLCFLFYVCHVYLTQCTLNSIVWYHRRNEHPNLISAAAQLNIDRCKPSALGWTAEKVSYRICKEGYSTSLVIADDLCRRLEPVPIIIYQRAEIWFKVLLNVTRRFWGPSYFVIMCLCISAWFSCFATFRPRLSFISFYLLILKSVLRLLTYACVDIPLHA